MKNKLKADYLELTNAIKPLRGRSRGGSPGPPGDYYQSYLNRPYTAPEPLSVSEVSSLVTRLYRPNTSTGRKAVLWSMPRQVWEENYTATAILASGETWMRYEKLQKHYPGPWTVVPSAEEQKQLNERMSKPTVSSACRASTCIQQRRYVERYKAAALAADIGYKKKYDKNPKAHKTAGSEEEITRRSTSADSSSSPRQHSGHRRTESTSG